MLKSFQQDGSNAAEVSSIEVEVHSGDKKSLVLSEEGWRRNHWGYFAVVTAAFTTGTTFSPFSLQSGGYVWGTICLIYSAGITYYTGILIGRMVLKNPKLTTYPQLGAHAFGEAGYLFGLAMQFISYYLLNIALYVECANWFQIATRNVDTSSCVSEYIFYVGLMAIMLGQTVSFRAVFPLCVMSLIVTFLKSILLWSTVAEEDLLEKCDADTSPDLDWINFLSSLSNTALMFGGHGMFPEEVREMKQPKDYQKALTVAYVAVVFLYVTYMYVAFPVWGTFGADKGDMWLWPNNNTTTIAAVTSMVWGLITATITHVVMFLHLEQRFLGLSPRHHLEPLVYGLPPVLVRLALRSAFISTEVFWALMLQNSGISNIQVFVGAVGFSALTYWFPILVYWKVEGAAHALEWQVFYAVNIFIGVFIMFSGCYVSIYLFNDEASTYSVFGRGVNCTLPRLAVDLPGSDYPCSL